MARKSSVDRLGPEVRDAIGRLLDQGRTLDEILAHLEGMSVEVSRSALHRYTQKIAAAGEKLRQSRIIGDALIRRFGDEPESKTARLNIQLIQTLVFDLLMKAEDDGDPDMAVKLSRALESLTRASRNDIEVIERAEKRAAERARKDAAVAAEDAGRQQGLSAATIEAIKQNILGLRA